MGYIVVCIHICGIALTCADSTAVHGCNASSPCSTSGRHSDLNSGPTLAVTDWLSVSSLFHSHWYHSVTNGYIISINAASLFWRSTPWYYYITTTLHDLKRNWIRNTWKQNIWKVNFTLKYIVMYQQSRSCRVTIHLLHGLLLNTMIHYTQGRKIPWDWRLSGIFSTDGAINHGI